MESMADSGNCSAEGSPEDAGTSASKSDMEAREAKTGVSRREKGASREVMENRMPLLPEG